MKPPATCLREDGRVRADYRSKSFSLRMRASKPSDRYPSISIEAQPNKD